MPFPGRIVMLALLTGLGAWLIADAALRGGLLRYQLAGYALGGALCVPAFVAMTCGTRGRRVLRRSLFTLLPAGALIVVLEVGLRLSGLGVADEVVVVVDAQLGHRLVPGRGAADAGGWRNRRALDAADVVFVGDSQVYGFGVGAEATLPEVVARTTGLRVYSMALGGYGPVQYRELVRRALALRPRVIVVGFYFGNDLLDAFHFAHLPGAADLRREGIDYPRHQAVETRRPSAPNLSVAVVEGLTRLSQLADLTARALRTGLRGSGGIWDAEPGMPRFDGGPIATLFTPEYRAQTLDPARAPIAEGLLISQQCLQAIGAETRAAGVSCIFLPIHTKEHVYQRMLVADGSGRDDLVALAALEVTAAATVGAAARGAGFAIADPTERLHAALRAGHAVWPAGSDGHLTAVGHGVLAATMAAALQDLGITAR